MNVPSLNEGTGLETYLEMQRHVTAAGLSLSLR